MFIIDMLTNCTFHHIGYAVKDIAITAAFYTKAGWMLSDIYTDRIQNTFIAFLSRDGFPMIELVAPIDESSPICNILKKVGNATYHVCYEVPDIDSAIMELRALRYMPLFKPVEAVGINNKRICYLMNPEVGLIEVVEQ